MMLDDCWAHLNCACQQGSAPAARSLAGITADEPRRCMHKPLVNQTLLEMIEAFYLPVQYEATLATGMKSRSGTLVSQNRTNTYP